MKTLSKILIGASILAVGAGGVAYARGPMGGCGPMGGPQMGGPQMGGPQMGGPQMGGPMMKGAMLEQMFKKLDANGDGAVTREEAVKLVDERFAAIDANKDGVVDKTEVESWIGRRAPAQAVDGFLKRHDLDGDGKVTKAEFEKPFGKIFAVFDRNDDGKVTLDEARQAGPMAMGFAGPGRGGHGMGRHHGGWGMSGPGMGWMQPGAGPMAGPMGGPMGGPQDPAAQPPAPVPPAPAK